ncbi:hypothetical protein BO70DRAFT_430099 [Aspergillus heteromorphus CBS 117.55]|uniref:LITAF domain-containing protein n=1 Tax=Aspergillus heteromorphus CBS 117.55 TaxID=1448321 RepID=A0A317VY78_9EURO|nr:uncharacterized protein BO70DRAFT_430099 [Aspergillus heteromorphus CBS 117.55]PWY79314.1 hypothetical protein BO70DRAFT_430099 [Aspergillus heteromorphus CBS 117.55]
MAEETPLEPVPAYEEPAEIQEPAPIVSPSYSQPPLLQPLEQQHRQSFYAGTQHPSGYNSATPLHALQKKPGPVDCPACGHRQMTKVQAESGKTTHGWAAVLCCCCCLGCVPYLMSSLKDTTHHCGQCGVLLATWHKSGRNEVHLTGSS